LACVAALAVLEVIERQNLMVNAATVGSYLIEQLSAMNFAGGIRGMGLMIGFDVPSDRLDLRSELLTKYKILTGEAKPNVIRLLPSLALTKQEADIFLQAMVQLLNPVEVA
jgi:acetylornithine aminotransferase